MKYKVGDIVVVLKDVMGPFSIIEAGQVSKVLGYYDHDTLKLQSLCPVTYWVCGEDSVELAPEMFQVLL